MEISYEKGLIIRDDNKRIMLDPEYARTPLGLHTIVSHAHSDHTQAVSSESRTHLNQITLDLFNATQSRNAKSLIIHELYQPFEVGPFEIEFINAGHLLGATQIVVRKGNDSFLYTGDFCPEPLITVKGADFPKNIDILTLDCTYGSPKIFFDARSKTRRDIFSWIIKVIKEGRLPVVNVNKMGNAQELIKYLNKLLPNFPIITEQSISKINEVYNKHRQQLQYIDIESKNISKLLETKCVVILPRSQKTLPDFIPKTMYDKIIRCIITGQSAKFGFSKYDHAIPLSTHASFNELIDFVNKINPGHVLTNFGYHKEFADHITKSDMHCNATSIKNMQSISPKDFKAKVIFPELKTNNNTINISNWFDTE